MPQKYNFWAFAKKMQEQTLSLRLKTNSKLILKRYDKNLLQSNSHFPNCEIPILWGF
jgi:hypothetical protein